MMLTGVDSAGLSTTQLPAAMAGASFQAAIRIGKFQGMIWPDHAQRLMEVVGDGVLVDLAQAAFLRAQAAGEVAEVVEVSGMSAFSVSRIGLPLSTVSA